MKPGRPPKGRKADASAAVKRRGVAKAAVRTVAETLAAAAGTAAKGRPKKNVFTATFARVLALSRDDLREIQAASRHGIAMGDVCALLQLGILELSKGLAAGAVSASDFASAVGRLSSESRAVVEAIHALGPEVPSAIEITLDVLSAPVGCGDALVSA